MKEIVFLNGKILPFKEAKLSVLTPGFLYGWGLFETMRAYNKHIVYFDAHLGRLENSSKLIGLKLPCSLIKIKENIKKVVNLCNEKDAYIRLTLWKTKAKSDVLIVARKYQPYSLEKYRKGFSACVCPFRQNENSIFSQIKTTSYLLYRLAYIQAKMSGFDEAIILNNRGYIAEGSRSNLFFIKNKEIFTPDLACGCLNGITRRLIFDLAKKYKLKIYEGKFSLSDLYAADEAFLTNSLMGVMPLTSLEKKAIGQDKCKELTQFFIKKYHCLLR